MFGFVVCGARRWPGGKYGVRAVRCGLRVRYGERVVCRVRMGNGGFYEGEVEIEKEEDEGGEEDLLEEEDLEEVEVVASREGGDEGMDEEVEGGMVGEEEEEEEDEEDFLTRMRRRTEARATMPDSKTTASLSHRQGGRGEGGKSGSSTDGRKVRWNSLSSPPTRRSRESPASRISPKSFKSVFPTARRKDTDDDGEEQDNDNNKDNGENTNANEAPDGKYFPRYIKAQRGSNTGRDDSRGKRDKGDNDTKNRRRRNDPSSGAVSSKSQLSNWFTTGRNESSIRRSSVASLFKPSNNKSNRNQSRSDNNIGRDDADDKVENEKDDEYSKRGDNFNAGSGAFLSKLSARRRAIEEANSRLDDDGDEAGGECEEDIQGEQVMKRLFQGRPRSNMGADRGEGDDDEEEDDDDDDDDNDEEDDDEVTKGGEEVDEEEKVYRARLKQKLKREMISRNSSFSPKFTGRVNQDLTQLSNGDEDIDKGSRRRQPYQGIRAEQTEDGKGPNSMFTEEEVKNMFQLDGANRGPGRRGQTRPELQEPVADVDEYIVEDENGATKPLRDQFSDDKMARRFASFLGGMRGSKNDKEGRDSSPLSPEGFFKQRGDSARGFGREKKSDNSNIGGSIAANGAGSLRDRLRKISGESSRRTDKVRPKSNSSQEDRIHAQRGIFMPPPEDYPDYDEKDAYERKPLNWDIKLATDTCDACKGDGLITCPYCLGEEWIPPLEEYLADPVGEALNRPEDDPSIRYVKRRPPKAILKKLQEFWRRPNLVIAENGWAQCRFCALGKSFCTKCEGSGSRAEKGFEYEAEYRRAFPEELHEDVGLDELDQPYLVFPHKLPRRPKF